ncbi:initiation factor 2 [Cristinia sonorae]|uniref:Translation initiation factor IF-2, mitochondrial n=1 Tax=Cristinia sonorae TaxID=1940300 RepID=A0A8K0UWK1_9AGAR|nr:initiation factor 2 [Cristinia sonorae]
MTQVGMGTDTSHDHMLSSEYSSLLALEFGRDPVVDDEAAFDIHPPPVAKDKSALPSRPPVVTIMGHVDHGKTTLLDTLRSASVAKGEAGGITQHIGAFSVPVKGEVGRSITFLDTPGHAAFSAMRARGAGVTDIVVLVVAADDGVMPQTREVIDLVKKDGDNVSLVVAINKVDKPGADAEKVEQALLAEGVQLETFGGDVPCVHVSGLTGRGLDRLVETISLVAEMQDLRAEKQGPVHGYVLESKVQKGLGPVATVLLLRGSLTPGSHLICGHTQAKVRLLTSPSGQQIKLVQPGEAVVVSGWKELPGAGDEVLSGTEAEVKKALVNRIRKAEIEATLQDVDAINITRREERERREEELQAKRDRRGQPQRVEAEKSDVDEIKELRVLVKGDVSGSVEAVAGAIQGIGNHLAKVKIIATGVGEVTESDVMRAKAAEGMIIAFSVKAPKAIESLAAGQEVPILSSSVIYRLMDSVKNEVIKLLPVTIERRVRGEASVLEIFDIHLKAKKIMKVAGCRVTNGVIEKNKNARVVRNGETVFEGRLDTFRHLKKDITEAGKGLECGMSLVDFSDLQPGDMIQMYEEIEIPGSL